LTQLLNPFKLNKRNATREGGASQLERFNQLEASTEVAGLERFNQLEASTEVAGLERFNQLEASTEVAGLE
jgi:hypothetical protein